MPRFRICGEPTVREASASAGSRSASGAVIASVYVSAAPRRSRSPSSDHPRSSSSSARLTIAGGREWAKLSSTITSVPPWMKRASGRSALSASASSTRPRGEHVHDAILGMLDILRYVSYHSLPMVEIDTQHRSRTA